MWRMPLLARAYDLYSFAVLPRLGAAVAGDRDAYQYLVESIRRFPPQDALARAHARGRVRAGRLSQPHRRHRRASFRLAALSALRLARLSDCGHRRCRRCCAARAISCASARSLLTLARYDALFPLERVAGAALVGAAACGCCGAAIAALARLRPGQRLAEALQALGPSFIKLGQALSLRADLVGDAIAGDLALLQDRLPPFPGAQARAVGRKRARRAARDAVPLLRRRADRRRLDRAGPSRGHQRGRGGRGQGAAPRHRRRVRARHGAVRLACAARRAAGAGLCAASSRARWSRRWRNRCGSRWICASRRPPPRSCATISPTIRPSVCRGSIGAAPRARC